MDPLIKKRRFKVAGIQDRETSETIRAGLSALQGVERVAVQPPDHLLAEYDLMQVKLRDIGDALARLGHPMAPGFFRRIWKGWIGFTEDNVADNLRAPISPCCSNPRLNEDKES
jgi:hypothetical protein